MHQGTVKFFDDKKGFGFIECPELNGRDVFVHFKVIDSKAKRRTLANGAAVEFEYDDSMKGLKATYAKAI